MESNTIEEIDENLKKNKQILDKMDRSLEEFRHDIQIYFYHPEDYYDDTGEVISEWPRFSAVYSGVIPKIGEHIILDETNNEFFVEKIIIEREVKEYENNEYLVLYTYNILCTQE